LGIITVFIQGEVFKMRKLSLGLIVIFILLLGLAAAHAQQTSSFDKDYNWCNAGERWGDGRCNNSTNQDLIYCHWQMGWYLPRLLAGEFRLEDIKSPCLVIVKAAEGDTCVYLIVVLPGSPYTGPADINGSGDDFDATSLNLGCIAGLEIHGNDNDNFIFGSFGDDTIYGYGGDDFIIGDGCGCDDGAGDDVIYGGDGFDIIFGDSEFGAGSGNDVIDGGNDDDVIFGDSADGDGSGNDVLNGGGGDDLIVGDSIFGDGSGDDVIDGGGGDDLIVGDSVFGAGSGDDVIDGGADFDEVTGTGSTGDTVTNVETDTSTP
jgi:hypothetical protein